MNSGKDKKNAKTKWWQAKRKEFAKLCLTMWSLCSVCMHVHMCACVRACVCVWHSPYKAKEHLNNYFKTFQNLKYSCSLRIWTLFILCVARVIKYYITLHCITLHFNTFCYKTLYTLHFKPLRYLHYNEIPYITIHCCTLHFYCSLQAALKIECIPYQTTYHWYAGVRKHPKEGCILLRWQHLNCGTGHVWRWYLQAQATICFSWRQHLNCGTVHFWWYLQQA